MDVSDLRKGVKIKMDGAPHVVTHFDFMKPGKGQAVYRCKLKNMLTGNQFDKSWRSGDKMEKADLRSGSLIYSYQEDDQYLYVNRGFGFLGFPGRIGILPEITIMELTSKPIMS